MSETCLFLFIVFPATLVTHTLRTSWRKIIHSVSKGPDLRRTDWQEPHPIKPSRPHPSVKRGSFLATFTLFLVGPARPNSSSKGGFDTDSSHLNDLTSINNLLLQCADCRGYTTKVQLWTSAWLPSAWVLPQRNAVMATSHHASFQQHHVTNNTIGLLPRRTFSLTFLKRFAPTTEWVGVRPRERRIYREPPRTSKKCKQHNCKPHLLCPGQAFVWMSEETGFASDCMQLWRFTVRNILKVIKVILPVNEVDISPFAIPAVQ